MGILGGFLGAGFHHDLSGRDNVYLNGAILGMTEEEANRALTLYREYFSVTGLFENPPYDGVENALAQLKNAGCTLVLATSKPEKFAVRILEHFGLAKYFDRICGASMDTSRSSKEDVIAYLLKQVDSIENTVMIGDTKFDVLGAAEHSIPTIGITWGYGEEEDMEAAGAKAIARSMEELLALLNS